MINIVFFGSPEFAVPSLQLLSRQGDFEIRAVVTHPDTHRGRSLMLQPTPVATAAHELHLDCIKSESINNELMRRLKSLHADCYVVVAYGILLPRELLNLPRYGALNLHPSLLPHYRGASPIQTALLNGDVETGVSIMQLDEEMDHGPVLWQKSVSIEHRDTSASLSERLAGIGAKLLNITIPRYIKGALLPQPQNHSMATFTRQIKKKDGKIEWNMPAEHIARMVRAYHPWPGAWTTYEHLGKKEILKINHASPLHPDPNYKFIPFKDNQSGEVAQTEYGRFMIPLSPSIRKEDNVACMVFCGNQTLLRLDAVQPAGKKVTSAVAFIHGHKYTVKLG